MFGYTILPIFSGNIFPSKSDIAPGQNDISMLISNKFAMFQWN